MNAFETKVEHHRRKALEWMKEYELAVGRGMYILADGCKDASERHTREAIRLSALSPLESSQAPA